MTGRDIDLFDPDRTMLSSQLPICCLFHGFHHLCRNFRDLLEGFSPNEQDLMFRRIAADGSRCGDASTSHISRRPLALRAILRCGLLGPERSVALLRTVPSPALASLRGRKPAKVFRSSLQALRFIGKEQLSVSLV